MAKYNGSIKNLLQGISQQPERERRPEQLKDQINCLSSVTRGLGKRPGTYLIDFLGDAVDFTGKTFYHYDRGDTEEAYLFMVDNTGIRVFDLFTGAEKTVTTPDGIGYLAATDPTRAFRFHTVADTTFILNREKEPAMGNPTDDSTDWQVMVYCKQANWGKDYEVIIDGTVVASYTTPSTVTLNVSTTKQDVDKRITLDTTDIIDALAPGIRTWATTNGVRMEKEGDVIYLYKASASYKIQTQDGNNGNDLFVIGKRLDNYDKLPVIAKNGYKVKITGVDRSELNDYYVEFLTEDGVSIGRGVWQESAGFGVDQDFVAATMPHQIVREADGSFTLKEIEWASRTAGDDDSNPKPSFVGSTISDILTYQGRLILTTEENQVASVTFDFFNFFANSVLQTSDDDPIDTASSDTQVTDLNHTLVFNSSLVSFSDSAQFFHPGDVAFTSKTFSLASKSKYPASAITPPVAAASSVFFPYSFGKYSGIRELRFDELTGNMMANPITDHVRKYIEGDVVQLEASPGYNKLFIRTNLTPNRMYVYEWYDRDNSRLQAAWGHWNFAGEILYTSFVRNDLYILLQRNGYAVLERIDVSDTDTQDIPFPVRLDTMEYVEGSVGADYWTIPTTVTDTDPETIRVIAADGTGKAGLLVEHYEEGGEIRISDELIISRYENNFVNPIYVEAKYTETPQPFFWVGVPYEAKGTLTNPYLRDNEGEPITTEKLRLNYVEFNTAATGYLKLNLTKGGTTFEKVYNARIIDRVGLFANNLPDIQDAKIRLSLRSDRDRCEVGFASDDHTPFYILDINWTGNYSSSGRRV